MGEPRIIMSQGDCRKVLRNLGDASVDAVVTDPPYELGFMGKSWDRSGIAFDVGMWKEVLRVLKPGGHLLCFGGSRTYHRAAVAIEDAGFELRDTLMWLTGSGMPKGLNLGKAIDKHLGTQGEVVGVSQERGMNRWNDYRHDKYQDYSEGTPIRKPGSEAAATWEDWHTALKPAHEPIVMARKPLDGTNVENVLKHGVGGLNIKDTRVGTSGSRQNGRKQDTDIFGDFGKVEPVDYNRGRHPANIIMDSEAAEVLDGKTGTLKSGANNVKRRSSKDQEGNTGAAFGAENRPEGTPMVSYGDSGGASRFFTVVDWGPEDEELLRFYYCGKATRKERGQDNKHPTVKPLALMEWLIKLVTPPGGMVLDPFAGSGTTGLAARRLGFNFRGVELDFDHAELARSRMEAHCWDCNNTGDLIDYQYHGGMEEYGPEPIDGGPCWCAAGEESLVRRGYQPVAEEAE